MPCRDVGEWYSWLINYEKQLTLREDETGDLKELKDRQRNFAPPPLFPSLKEQKEKQEGEETGRERQSHLKAKNSKTQSSRQVCLCARKWADSGPDRSLPSGIHKLIRPQTRGNKRGRRRDTKQTETLLTSVGGERWRVTRTVKFDSNIWSQGHVIVERDICPWKHSHSPKEGHLI